MMLFLFISFLLFAGVFATAAYYVWSVPQQQAQDLLTTRLRELRISGEGRRRSSGDLMRREERGRLGALGKFVTWVGGFERLQLYINQANLKYRASEVFTVCVLVGAIVYIVFGLIGLHLAILRIALALVVGAYPVVHILRVRKARLRKFQESLPDAIDLFNRTMRAGHNIHSGLETIAQETADPVRMEFRKVIEELALGAPLEQTLHGLGNRVPLIDLKFFVTGLILQRQTGANMVQVLENLAVLIRERLNLVAKIKAATAQQRLSAILLCIFPVVVGLGFWALKPAYMALLFTDELGQKFLTYAIISEMIGILIIRKIANPKF